jgi:CBS domain-containing protein
MADFKERVSGRDGSVMSLASTEVVTIPPTTSIKGALDTMARHRFRRLPVTDPGSGRLVGIVGSSDMMEFLGGGDKFGLVTGRHRGNLLAAINDSVRRIMVTDVLTLDAQGSVRDVLDLLLASRVGGVVILGREREVEAIVTERDFVPLLAGLDTGVRVEDHMTRDVITVTPGTTLRDAARIMVEKSFRRLPVVSQGSLVGMVTTRTFIDFLGKNRIFEMTKDINQALETRVEAVMEQEFLTLSRDADLGEAARNLEERGRGTACVLEDGALVGILTERNLIEVFS